MAEPISKQEFMALTDEEKWAYTRNLLAELSSLNYEMQIEAEKGLAKTEK